MHNYYNNIKSIYNKLNGNKIYGILFKKNVLKSHEFASKNNFDENVCQIKKLKNIHKNKRAFIIGNGPSLCISDLDRLKDEVTFACNKIYLAFDQTDWRPTYLFLADTMVAKNNVERIESLFFRRSYP